MCVCACVRACVRVCARARVCVCVCVCVISEKSMQYICFMQHILLFVDLLPYFALWP